MSKYIVIIVIVIGSILRIILSLSTPPNNSYDDHLAPIAKYINNNSRPMPQECWQCYQPPLYYFVASKVFITSYLVFDNYYLSWKFVQFINVLLSIINLVIISLLLRQIYFKNELSIAVLISFLSFYPRDIYASVMITNDYLLVVLTSLSVLLFINFVKNESKINYLLLCFCVFCCSISKQHGLILIVLNLFIIFKSIYLKYKFSNFRYFYSVITIICCLSDEIWKFLNTGILLVSNQNFFNYTINQLPGDFNDISFTSFYFMELLHNPFLSTTTLHSFWTEIFARSWFDYEWRFLSPKILSIQYLSISLYLVGLLVLITVIIGVIKYRSKLYKLNINYFCLVFICLCFFAVPVLQTYRFPYFSSMKSQFFLPAISIICLGLYYLYIQLNIKSIYMFIMISLFLFIGVFHVMFIVFHMNFSLDNLNAPLWQFPFINSYSVSTTFPINKMIF